MRSNMLVDDANFFDIYSESPTQQSAFYYDVASSTSEESFHSDNNQEPPLSQELDNLNFDLDFQGIDLSSFSARVNYELTADRTKIIGAIFNTDTNQISSVFAEYSFPMGYGVDLAQSDNQTFSDLIMDLSLLKLAEYKNKVQRDFDKLYLDLRLEHSGVATQVFRVARNNFDFLQKIEDNLGIHFEVLTQDEEAALVFSRVQTKLQTQNPMLIFEPPLVWDIASHDMQLISQDESGNTVVMQSVLASKTFQRLVEQQVKQWNEQSHSPNPFTPSEFEATLSLAKGSLQFNEKDLQNVAIQLIKGHKVYAVGPVHQQSVLRAVQKIFNTQDTHYTKDQVLLCAKLLSELDDDEISLKLGLKKSSLLSSQVTDLILVYAMMDKLNIDSVDTLHLSI